MSKSALNQKRFADHAKAGLTASNLVKNSHSALTEGSILECLWNFAFSVPDFRRLDKGNIQHKLGDLIILMILARMSKCVGRADIIEFGKHNLKKLQSSMGILKHGVPSEPTLCRIENGIDALGFAQKLAEFTQAFHEEFIKTCSIINIMLDIICIDGKALRGTVLENGRNPDIVSAFSPFTGLTLSTEACEEKSNEIKAAPLLISSLNLTGKLVTADAMFMQKGIIDKIREKNGYFLIELKANQRALRYSVEDKIKEAAPLYTYTDGPELGHGRIESRTYNIYDGLELIADKEKWGGNLTVVEFVARTCIKSTGEETTETRLYVTNIPLDTPWLGDAVRLHWSIESMHWGLDVNLRQDNIKRKSPAAARNLDTIQRLVVSLFSIWKGRRKKRSDKLKGVAALMRGVSMSLTKLLKFLSQK